MHFTFCFEFSGKKIKMGHAGIRLCHFSMYINHIVLEVSAKTIDTHEVKR